MRSSSPRRTGRAARVRSPACINRSVTDDDINSLIDGVLEESGLQMKVAHVVVPYVTVELLYRIRELVNARGSASTRKTQAVLNAVAAHACGWPHDSGGEQYNGNSMNTYIGRWVACVDKAVKNAKAQLKRAAEMDRRAATDFFVEASVWRGEYGRSAEVKALVHAALNPRSRAPPLPLRQKSEARTLPRGRTWSDYDDHVRWILTRPALCSSVLLHSLLLPLSSPPALL